MFTPGRRPRVGVGPAGGGEGRPGPGARAVPAVTAQQRAGATHPLRAPRGARLVARGPGGGGPTQGAAGRHPPLGLPFVLPHLEQSRFTNWGPSVRRPGAESRCSPDPSRSKRAHIPPTESSPDCFLSRPTNMTVVIWFRNVRATLRHACHLIGYFLLPREKRARFLVFPPSFSPAFFVAVSK